MAYAENGPLLRWVATDEAVLEPALPIVDPHHHLWDLRSRDGGGGFAQKLYLCEDIVTELREGGHNVRQTVFMQCNAFHRQLGPVELQPVGETEFANGVAAMSASGAYGEPKICAGIISTVDLSLGVVKADAALRAHMRASPNFRGIRAAIPPAEGLTPGYHEAFALLGTHGLLYEQYHHDFASNLPVLAELAAAHPTVTIVINHLGGKLDFEEIPPGSDAFAKWKECLATVAACPNVVMKCGGLTPPSEMPIHMSRRATPIGSVEVRACSLHSSSLRRHARSIPLVCGAIVASFLVFAAALLCQCSSLQHHCSVIVLLCSSIISIILLLCSWPSSGFPTTRSPSSCSGPTAACLNRTSQLTKSGESTKKSTRS